MEEEIKELIATVEDKITITDLDRHHYGADCHITFEDMLKVYEMQLQILKVLLVVAQRVT